ncbi:MAG TPA: isoprenylcysteine carboxylmethyltransferase family protein [Candidatus Limnocylindria bacterium]|nr:isoprenylcysteine carboxylmethyltransferase family protein [Candidatus Limnocylindria bacterium]
MIVLRSLISVAILPGLVAVVLPWLIVQPVSWPTGVALVGIVPLVLGLGISAWCVTLFATRGRGTPAPWDAPRRFVAIGPYRLVRNPMYLGVGSIVFGEAILFGSLPLLGYLAVLVVVWHLFVILWEEPSLERTFGDEYRAYRANVPRWLPRMP